MKHTLMKGAAALLLAVGCLPLTTAMAEEPAATGSAGLTENGILPIEKNLLADVGTVMAAETFSFTVKPAEVAEGTILNGSTVYSGVALTNNTFSTTISAGTAATYDDANGDEFNGLKNSVNVDFNNAQNVKFEKAGIYRYTVTEVQGTDEAITYDASSYTVDVYVIYETQNDNTEKLVAKYVAAYKGTEKSPVIFKNTLNTGSLKIAKKVTGNQGDKTKEFTFKVKVGTDACLPADTELSAVIAKGDGTTETVTLKAGTETSIKLKHGQSLVIGSIPVGVQVDAYEAEANQDNYTTTLKNVITDADDTDLKVSDKMTADGLDYLYTNNRGTIVNTGVFTNAAPYLEMMAVVVIGAIVLISLRRHTSEQ